MNLTKSFHFINNQCTGFSKYHWLMQSVKRPWGEDDPIVEQLRTGNFDEHRSLALMAFLLESAPEVPTIIDCGAFAGLYSLFAARVRNDCFAIGLEPSAVTFGRFVQNIQLNELNNRILPLHLAAGSEQRVMALPHQYGIFNLCPGEALSKTHAPDHTETVLCIKLDALIEGKTDFAASRMYEKRFPLRDVTVVKVDVEGAELSVLKGASQLIEEFKPVFICEALNDTAFNELVEFFGVAGYVAKWIQGERNIVAATPSKMERIDTHFPAWLDEKCVGEYIISAE